MFESRLYPQNFHLQTLWTQGTWSLLTSKSIRRVYKAREKKKTGQEHKRDVVAVVGFMQVCINLKLSYLIYQNTQNVHFWIRDVFFNDLSMFYFFH